jgi:hypothetical protein
MNGPRNIKPNYCSTRAMKIVKSNDPESVPSGDQALPTRGYVPADMHADTVEEAARYSYSGLE